MPAALTIEELATFLDSYLGAERFPTDTHGIYHPGSRTIENLGLAIEPWPAIGQWAQEQELDAIFLHRPWHARLHTLPAGVGILAYHLAFDLSLTLGYNPRLAEMLGMRNLVPCVFRDGIAYGMLGDIAAIPLKVMINDLSTIFGHPPAMEPEYVDSVRRIAVVGAMTDASIRETADLGAQVYITGQFRQPARAAVQQTRMTVATIGHAICEQRGLRDLGSLLSEHWPQLKIVYP
ncbi:Nif3-like dinuclear metal center hexameric protein [Dictyobacter aurantiacus]|uniref:GTP cyclohydrolase 1 type 2 homolog n=1 Tax=Dictyobacter aurantiacus TaxID=1936993 RepID=A0A401ZNE1_9CHLR|nr:Nif3-like dinuclear metal center hexameric protein [Dictyobacter aurantiacus]GCE08407.1 hypothetical protein KDAU_57360 [Dictyobacter aurantiacus]